MWSPTFGRLAVLTAFSLLIAGHDISCATPLADGAGAQPGIDPRSARPLSETEVVNTGTLRPDDGLLSPQTAESVVQHYLKGASGEAGNTWTRDSISGFELGANAGSPLEIFRSLVNVPKGNARNAAPRKGSPVDDALTLGPEAREWVDDAVRGIVNSVVELRTNEQGRTSFSVLGMGDFGIMMSADRNEVALVSGDDNVLLTANRAPLPMAQGAGFAETSMTGYPTAGPAGGSGDHTLQRVIETLQETATHPLSMLFYAIVIGFIVLWQILSAQANRRPAAHSRAHPAQFQQTAAHRSSGKHRSRRSRRR